MFMNYLFDSHSYILINLDGNLFFRRTKGVVGAVRNQKTCGACWAFSTVETVESMAAMKTGSLQVLSVQEVSIRVV